MWRSCRRVPRAATLDGAANLFPAHISLSERPRLFVIKFVFISSWTTQFRHAARGCQEDTILCLYLILQRFLFSKIQGYEPILCPLGSHTRKTPSLARTFTRCGPCASRHSLDVCLASHTVRIYSRNFGDVVVACVVASRSAAPLVLACLQLYLSLSPSNKNRYRHRHTTHTHTQACYAPTNAERASEREIERARK